MTLKRYLGLFLIFEVLLIFTGSHTIGLLNLKNFVIICMMIMGATTAMIYIIMMLAFAIIVLKEMNFYKQSINKESYE